MLDDDYCTTIIILLLCCNDDDDDILKMIKQCWNVSCMDRSTNKQGCEVRVWNIHVLNSDEEEEGLTEHSST